VGRRRCVKINVRCATAPRSVETCQGVPPPYVSTRPAPGSAAEGQATLLFGGAEGNFELVVVGDFDDDEGYAAYAANADHQAVIASRIRPFLADRAAVQYRT